MELVGVSRSYVLEPDEFRTLKSFLEESSFFVGDFIFDLNDPASCGKNPAPCGKIYSEGSKTGMDVIEGTRLYDRVLQYESGKTTRHLLLGAGTV